jgi:hypothetical protein
MDLFMIKARPKAVKLFFPEPARDIRLRSWLKDREVSPDDHDMRDRENQRRDASFAGAFLTIRRSEKKQLSCCCFRYGSSVVNPLN